ncbi:amidohydrolase family protein [Flagellimonas flava]|uniref:Predicted metal-dependent hydrolase, TIM-barrel fold n=1 Tax=Flagellimonas flava TaxID=570519 RepID=A0A1M5ISL1_9FLAO|nr:amidohydrolase family protein [Allomuricauda flava]SHG31297.1 Predicted metal-dependent hydrolase, TIM-barrel fold [Allomuricauda flava]
MIKTYTVTLIFLWLISFGYTQEMGFEEYNPESTLVVPEHPVQSAKFPFIDVHSHQFGMASQDLSELVKDMDALNLSVMVNLSGGSGAGLRAMLKNVNDNYPNRFVVFANVDFSGVGSSNWGELAAAQLELDVKSGAKGLKIYKSLGMRYKDTDGNRVSVDDPRLDPIWAKCAELGIPVLIHSADPKSFWDPMDAQNERWLELKTRPRRKRSDNNPAPWQQIIDEQHRMFKRHPKTKFINAHMGWYANNLKKLGQLLDEIPNMYVGIGAIIAELGRQPRQAKQFFIAYQDRILFGKDSWKPEEFPTYFRVLETADEYFPYYKKYHAFWAMYGLDLPDEVLRKVYHENALKLIPGLDTSLFK